MPVAGVYAITDRTTGKRYIGSSRDIYRRWEQHRSQLRKGTHHCIYLQRAWKKQGESCFSFTVIETCTPRDLLSIEQRYINEGIRRANLFNVSAVASSGSLYSNPNTRTVAQRFGNAASWRKKAYCR